MTRDDIQIISRHSNWSEQGVDKMLKEKVYPDRKSWIRFLHLFFISLGTGFTVCGIIFFFAFNWAGMHKFLKMGILEFLLIAAVIPILILKLNQTIKNVILTGASILVGAMLAVYGQIYQTGANAYDFFLGWIMFITIWVLISNFAPLWLLFILLINTTIVLYSQQVASYWNEMMVLNILFIMNSAILTGFLILSNTISKLKIPAWFTNTLALATVALSTTGIVIGIFYKQDTEWSILIAVSLLFFTGGLVYGYHYKRTFYLSVIPLSFIVVISSMLIDKIHGDSMFFVVSVFIILSITALIKGLLVIQKKWDNERHN